MSLYTFSQSEKAADTSKVNNTVGDNDDKIFMSVEEMPSYNGGEEALGNFVSQKIKPFFIEEETASFRFIVTKNGEIKDIKRNGGFTYIEDKFIRVLSKIKGQWISGKQNHHPVNAYMQLKIAVNKDSIKVKFEKYKPFS